jgi:flagellar basal body-associated protein FliL
MNQLYFILLMVGFILLTVIAGYFALKLQKERMAAWAEFAQRHGMQASGFKVEGFYEGYPLTVETQSRGSGKNRYTVAVLHLSVQDSLPPEFSLEREGFGDKILRLFGKQDAQLGDADFDKYFDLKNLAPSTAAVLRHPSVQQHLYELVNHYHDFHIRDGWLQAERRRIPYTAEELEDFTGPALMLVHTLEETARRTHRWTTG